jgi:phosphate starvation-inducible PhoH-like protein
MFVGVFAKKPLHFSRTTNQNKYVSLIKSNDLIFCLGPAGTGKTTIACIEAITNLKNREVDKVILTRPIVSVEDEQLGFLPGNINQKMDPWTRPIFDIFTEYYTTGEINQMIKNRVIEIAPLAFMRGRTFRNSFIIADEMQNSTPNQMLMLTTRIGENTKMVVTGDLHQSDKSLSNGLSDIVEKYKKYPKNSTIAMMEMTTQDIKRSNVVKTILEIYETPQSYYESVTPPLPKSSRRRPEISDAALIPKLDLPKTEFNYR